MAGLVERVRDLPDRRQVRLQLTGRARQIGRDLLAPWAARIDQAAARLTPAEARAVARFLDEVLATGPEPPEAGATSARPTAP